MGTIFRITVWYFLKWTNLITKDKKKLIKQNGKWFKNYLKQEAWYVREKLSIIYSKYEVSTYFFAKTL